jgi:hypothetical protein
VVNSVGWAKRLYGMLVASKGSSIYVCAAHSIYGCAAHELYFIISHERA